MIRCRCFLLFCAVLCMGQEDIAALKEDYIDMMGEEGYQPTRMATPVRRKKKDDISNQLFKPTKKEREVQHELRSCLSQKAHSSYHDSLDCYESALNDFRYNSTWLKRTGTLHALTESPAKAVALFNESVSILFTLARYKTKSDALLENGGVQFLTLFSHKDFRGSLEAAKLMAFNASYTRRTEDAVNIYEYLMQPSHAGKDLQVLWEYSEFLISNGLWDYVPNVLQKIPEIDPEFTGMPFVALATKMLGDSLPAIGKRLLSTRGTNASKEDLMKSNRFIKASCGVSDLEIADTYTTSDMASFVLSCFGKQLSKKGKLQQSFQKQQMDSAAFRIGFMQHTPLHILGMLGGKNDVLQKLLRFGIGVGTINRFGQTALHIAMGSGHYSIAKAILASGGDLRDKDSKQQTPIEYACAQASWTDRTKLAQLMEECTTEDPCDMEDDAVVLHVKGAPRKDHGGWEGTADTTPEGMRRLPGMKRNCMIDVRDGKMSGLDLLVDYVIRGKPVLLKGGISNKQSATFRKDALLSRLGKLRGKVAPFLHSDLYGSDVHSTVMTAEEYVRSTTEDRPGTFAEKLPRFDKKVLGRQHADVIPSKHILQEVIEKLSFTFNDFSGFKLNTSEEAYLSLGKPGGGDGAVVGSHTTLHAMPYGVKKWYLHPPPHAFVSSKHPKDIVKESLRQEEASNAAQDENPLAGRTVLSCEQHPGDVLVVPPFWGSLSVNMKEVVSIVTMLDLDSLVGTE
eukprot:TRINITY_DN15576_c0_g1_i2.p1 TRINITY_DN15576_c0_g1~~TRINITY_DN15576_c0_g1_i2.p1  ORF type:complete len:738 (+),score=151.61 TRINITY_DN15576_c0_g1_i2:33-2246(+)